MARSQSNAEVEVKETEGTANRRPRKLDKDIDGNVLTITVPSIGKSLTFPIEQFNADIQAKLAMYGMSQKLGDAAAGKDGQEAFDAIEKVAEGLMSGDWTTRAPAAPKVTKKEITNNLSNMSDEEQAAARELLAKLGIKV